MCRLSNWAGTVQRRWSVTLRQANYFTCWKANCGLPYCRSREGVWHYLLRGLGQPSGHARFIRNLHRRQRAYRERLIANAKPHRGEIMLHELLFWTGAFAQYREYILATNM
jgi:hypothetical protein